jgi:hypothetical protein
VNGMTNREARGIRRPPWLVVGVLSVVTAGWGLLNPGVYLGLIAPATRPGAFSQDVIAVGLAVFHLKRLSFESIALTASERDHSRQMQALSERREA